MPAQSSFHVVGATASIRAARKRSGTQNAIEKEDVIMTRIAVKNTRDSALLGYRRGLSSFLRCTFSVFAGLSICALQLTPPSGAQPLAGSGLAADVTPPHAPASPLDRIKPVTDTL